MDKPLYEYQGYVPKVQPLVSSTEKIHNAVILIVCVLGAIGVCLFSSCSVRPARAEELKASWYSLESLKREGTFKYSKGVMANGELFNDNAMVCANRLFPLGTMLRITTIKSNKSVIVRTTDRIGKRFGRTRIDLSKKAMETLGGKSALKKGLLLVKVEVV